jgi:hypothetical protein
MHIGTPIRGTIPVLDSISYSDTSISQILSDGEFNSIGNSRTFWEAKVQLVRKMASGTVVPSPEECMAIIMYTASPHIYEALLRHNESVLVSRYLGLLGPAVKSLPTYTGEVFIGCANLDRSLFTTGTEFMWPNYFSGSTMWRVAMENTPSFTTNARRGTIFVIKSQSGRLITEYSLYPYDSEVVFLPYTQFKVTNWYHGNVIALGQENIREHSFLVKEVDDEALPLSEMIKTDKALIIELKEIPT